MKGPQEKSGYFQGQSPFFVQRLVGVSADQGDHVELKCEVNGRPLPKVKWWKGSTPINPKDAGMIISHQGNHHFLTLESVRDSTTIAVNIENEHGYDSSQAEIEVRPPPPRPPLPAHTEDATTVVTKVATPSKFRRSSIQHSDYDSDWEASPIPPKWRPCHSDTEESTPTLRYRSVKPKLRAASVGHVEPRPASPPCPHQWESHEDIENLERSLRQRPTMVQTLDRKRNSASSLLTRNVQVIQTNKITKTSVINNEVKMPSPAPRPSRCHSTPVGLERTKKEFVSVRKRAKLLEDIILNQPSPPLPSTNPENNETMTNPKDHSSSPSERATPIKPEDIPGAVRVLPLPSSAIQGQEGTRGHRSASVDLNRSVNVGSSPSTISMTLPRASKSLAVQSYGVKELPFTASTASLGSSTIKTTTVRKFEEAITSRSRDGSGGWEDKRTSNVEHWEKNLSSSIESSTTRTSSSTASTLIQNKSNLGSPDEPPSIELTAYKCRPDGTSEAAADLKGNNGYEADTDDTLSRQRPEVILKTQPPPAPPPAPPTPPKAMFKPKKFLPAQASDLSNSVWRPSQPKSTSNEI